MKIKDTQIHNNNKEDHNTFVLSPRIRKTNIRQERPLKTCRTGWTHSEWYQDSYRSGRIEMEIESDTKQVIYLDSSSLQRRRRPQRQAKRKTVTLSFIHWRSLYRRSTYNRGTKILNQIYLFLTLYIVIMGSIHPIKNYHIVEILRQLSFL